MKALFTFIACLFAQLAFSQAETIEKSYAYTGQKLDLDLNFGTEVILKSWDKNEISVKITYEINEGKDNEVMDWKVDDSNGKLTVEIELDSKKLEKLGDCCCNSKNGNHWSGRGSKGNRVCVDIKVEVMMPGKSDVKVKTIVADVAVEGFSGNLDLETVTGQINLLWAKSAGAQVNIETVNGGIYTNMDLAMEKEKGLPKISSHKVKATYKSGGRALNLKTVTSDIYLKASDL
ncbi:hypothetical protein EV198_1230 [Roseivirga ehrenbergii]|uniref:Adhesin domain-containing protein n=1 Tax=Roseivirga ehrenbergii (strain DSM 102268 / JCM 13514 / KCTC 12282 / NCIMB 14502 / KMM 6017) TaxID=279360 RepID=A0A150XEE7_ROSEK|nr:hypothetical protein [Roseivirga ehrenbergii]KYG77105.1 hypothetical protein MB14_02585 [Roseivirga ehrenbergii]TCL14388.1 hypothetical protein EV198_1230 [Roseivirga ehrenbergii]